MDTNVNPFVDRLFRLADVPVDRYTPEQQRAVATMRKSVPALEQPVGPLRAFIRDPRVFECVLQMIEVETESAHLGKRLNRLTAIIVARLFNAQFEWTAHAGYAAREGVSPEVIEALRVGAVPPFEREDEKLVYDVIREIIDQRKLSEDTFARAKAILGDDGVFELISHTGFYTWIGITICALDILAPAPAPDRPLPVG